MVTVVHDKILDHAGGVANVPCVIVGQKCDLGGERSVVAFHSPQSEDDD